MDFREGIIAILVILLLRIKSSSSKDKESVKDEKQCKCFSAPIKKAELELDIETVERLTDTNVNYTK